MTAELTVSIMTPGAPGPFVLEGRVTAGKPNLLLVDLRAQKQRQVQLFFAAGPQDYIYNYMSPPGTYRKDPNKPNPTEFVGVWEGEIDGFFGGEGNLAKVKAGYVGTGVVDGTVCDVVRAEMTSPNRSVTYFIGRSDQLIRKSALTFGAGSGQQGTQTNTIRKLKLNAELKPDTFRFSPPANLRLFAPGQPQTGGGRILQLPVIQRRRA
jgi:outer membrane lipoprotein-sorting protein